MGSRKVELKTFTMEVEKTIENKALMAMQNGEIFKESDAMLSTNPRQLQTQFSEENARKLENFLDPDEQVEPNQNGHLNGSTCSILENERPQWDNKCEFFLSALGYAVGLGNVWRFPYMAYENGGGAFLIPYLVMLFVIGLPMFFMEFALGQYAGSGPIHVFGRLAPIFKGIGYGMVLVTIITEVYYNMVLSWGIYYLFSSFPRLPWSKCDTQMGSSKNCSDDEAATDYFLTNVLGITQEEGMEKYSLINPGGLKWDLVFCYFIAWLFVCMSLIKGVKSSGKVVYFTALFPYFVLSIIVIVMAPLDGAYEGIKRYLIPDPEKLMQSEVYMS